MQNTTATASTDPKTVRDSTSASLIAADKVAGTSVYDTRGEKLGTVEAVMLDKVKGQVVYAILAFGGFLGFGGDYHPLPWSALRYDRTAGGYVVNLDRAQLEGAPSYTRDQTVSWEDPVWGKRIDDYYDAAMRRPM